MALLAPAAPWLLPGSFLAPSSTRLLLGELLALKAHCRHGLRNVSVAWLAWQPRYFGEIVLSWGMEIRARKSREAQPQKNAGSWRCL